MSAAITNAVIAFEAVIVLAGLVILWRHVVSPRARRAPTQSPLPTWEGMPSDILMFFAYVLIGSFVASLIASFALKAYGLTGDTAVLIASAAWQLGMLAGVTFFAAWSPAFRLQASIRPTAIFRTGIATFLISMPILGATGEAWERLLNLLGVPAEPQDLIRLFAETKSSSMLGLLIVLATVIAPITEELIFRAGLFRFLRTRAPRMLALLIPAFIFAALHVNWTNLEGFASFAPLLVLALLFSVAYERTGHIGTVIVAHGLFNLNTIVQIFAGLNK